MSVPEKISLPLLVYNAKKPAATLLYVGGSRPLPYGDLETRAEAELRVRDPLSPLNSDHCPIPSIPRGTTGGGPDFISLR